jgi:hypothetical protein
MNKLIPQWGNKMTEDEAWDELERNQAKKWNTTDMAYRPNGLSVEQEPVAWVRDLTSPQPHCVTAMKYLSIADTDAGVKYIPVYAAPPKREWVGLTDEEIDYLEDAIDPAMYRVFARRIEAKLKEKNNG